MERHEPSTSRRRSPVRAAALALAGVAVLLFATTAAARPARTRRRRHAPPPVASALTGLLHSGAIQQSAYAEYLATYRRVQSSLSRLKGTRHAELAAVLANLEAMARARQLVASRLPVAFLTLQRNWEWWTSKQLLGSGARVGFPGSRLVWEHYAGQGIEIQWLATFGEANGYWFAHETSALQQVLGEAISLATQRAGGIAWEYMFRFDGGSPPWTSALSQGTALQALARAWSLTGEQRFLTAAQQALGIFKTAPPEGVAATASSAGAWYLQYTYAPGEHVINGFIQALVGLYEYTKLTGDPLGQQLFEAGDAQARAQLPRFDTGAWSMYDQHHESDLSYHELLAEFLEHLCQRTREGEPLAAGAAQTTGGQAAGAGGQAAGGSGQPGGGSAQAAGAGQIPGDEVYCATAEAFRQDLKTPPVVQLLTTTVNEHERAGVRIKLSKVSTVDMTVTLGEKTVWHNRATVEGGTPRLLWVTPGKPGAYGVALRARDLAGNEEVATGSIVVRARPRHVQSHRGRRRAAHLGAHRLA